jgi:predicted CXXCH cytochrome family protein
MLKGSMDSVCFGCHTEQETRFKKIYSHKPVMEGQCTPCHNAHGSEQAKLLNAAVPQLCTPCHGDLMKETAPASGSQGSAHMPFTGGECLTCHDAHASNIAGMIIKKEQVLCLDCHTDIDKGLSGAKSKHAPLVSGDCTKCHSPHNAKLNKLLLAQGTDLCLSCHKQLKERMAKEKVHSPVQKDCATCHTHHYSSRQHLFTDTLQNLCMQCHDAERPGFAKAHLNIKAGSMDCMSCHEPHVSKDPKLFKTAVHPPFDSRSCDDCHITDKR